jgi:hypothetical protein
MEQGRRANEKRKKELELLFYKKITPIIMTLIHHEGRALMAQSPLKGLTSENC